MKFSSILTIASLVSVSGVMAAPAPMVTPAPAAAVFKRVPAPVAPVANAAAAVAPIAAERDMDANDAASLVQGMYNGNYNGNNYNSNYNGNDYNSNYNDNNCDDNDDDCDNGNYSSYNGDSSDIGSAHDYIYNAAQSLSQVSQQMRQSMNGQMPRPVQTYLSQQSSRIAQASRIVDGGVPAMTRSASSFISLASAYQQAEATFAPNEHNIIEQVRNGSYNGAGSFKAPSILAFASGLGAVFVWTAL